jgi:hypothetical protein
MIVDRNGHYRQELTPNPSIADVRFQAANLNGQGFEDPILVLQGNSRSGRLRNSRFCGCQHCLEPGMVADRVHIYICSYPVQRISARSFQTWRKHI